MPDDLTLFRPIETWEEGGRKQSRVIYNQMSYRLNSPDLISETVKIQLEISEKEKSNVFFGLCPRFGDNGKFDLAFQIRTVRCLWADIDHITPKEALERVDKAGLPAPSIVVNSGHGVHLYWLLDEPYLIDDVGDPPPVVTEWTRTASGKKKSRKYIVEDGDRIYLDQQRHVSRLSPKAKHIQSILAGIAEAVGGDHTTDLSRLLRLAGSLNRKNQKNGREPVETELIECEPTRRYPLDTFKALASASPDTERDEQINVIPLPKPRKCSQAKSDKLDKLITACAVAPVSSRSEPDFALCCYAIRSGIDKEEAWSRVEQVGKFAERGREYFDITWGNAEYEVRAESYDSAKERFKSSDDSDGAESGTPTIIVDPQNTRVEDTLREITERLHSAGNCYRRSKQLVSIRDGEIKTILSCAELAGLVNQYAELYFFNGKKGEYKSLPHAYAETFLNKHTELGRLPAIKLFTRNPVYTQDWKLLEPGYDNESGIYYAGPAVEVREDTPFLNALLEDFCFKSPADRTNYIGMLLTALLVTHFIGSKPAVLFNGNQPGLGKTILAQIIAILRDGNPAGTASYNPNDEEMEKRLGAIVRSGATTVIIDNAKARGRQPCIESACLERSITDQILSYRLLGKSESIQAENSHIFCITANSSDVSRDLLSRSVVVNLYHEGNPTHRRYSIDDPEGYAEEHRVEILGELVGMVERWKAEGMPMAETNSRFNKRRWGNVVGGILEVNGEPDFLANVDEAEAQLDATRREFTEFIEVLCEDVTDVWKASELVKICEKHGLLESELGEGSKRSRATKMGTIATRFIGEHFPLTDGSEAVFSRRSAHKGKVYQVRIEGRVPNHETVAEPVPNLFSTAGSAP